jgi:hypothetical protein
MSLIPVAVMFASLLGGQQAPEKKVELRKIQVKAAGAELSVPKAWKTGKKEGNVVHSFKIPIEGSKKTFGRMDFGYVLDSSSDADAFLAAQRDLLTQQGAKVASQWKTDVQGSSFAFTKYTKEEETIVRGVLFRAKEAKLTILMAASPLEFSKVEGALLPVLESFKEIKVEVPRQAAVAVEKVYQLGPQGFPISRKRQQAHIVTLENEVYELLLPKGSKVSGLGETSFSVEFPGLPGTTVVNCYPMKAESSQELLVKKANESLGLFSGSVRRVDDFRRMVLGENQRFIIMREGIGAKSGKPLMTIDSIMVGVDGGVIYCFYLSSNAKSFRGELGNFKANLETTRIIRKK